jgi:hypothetical protein
VLQPSGNDAGTYDFGVCVPANAIAGDGTVALSFVGLTALAATRQAQPVETFRLLSMKIDYGPGPGC